MERNLRKERVGLVISNKMDKTIREIGRASCRERV